MERKKFMSMYKKMVADILSKPLLLAFVFGESFSVRLKITHVKAVYKTKR